MHRRGQKKCRLRKCNFARERHFSSKPLLTDRDSRCLAIATERLLVTSHVLRCGCTTFAVMLRDWKTKETKENRVIKERYKYLTKFGTYTFHGEYLNPLRDSYLGCCLDVCEIKKWLYIKWNYPADITYNLCWSEKYYENISDTSVLIYIIANKSNRFTNVFDYSFNWIICLKHFTSIGMLMYIESFRMFCRTPARNFRSISLYFLYVQQTHFHFRSFSWKLFKEFYESCVIGKERSAITSFQEKG